MGAILGSSYYTIVDGPSWTQAEANAVKLGGHLVSITSEEENSLVTSLMGENNIYNSSFIGFRNGRWLSGESLDYNNFHPDIKANPAYYFSNYPYAEIWAPSAEQIKQSWQTETKPGRWNTASNTQDGRNQTGIAEIPLSYVTITDDDTASGGITVNGYNNGTINTGTINNTTNNSNSNNTTTVINNVVNNYYNSNNTTTNVNTWNTYRVDNSVKARDIVTQWFGNDTSIQQALSLSETKLLDIQASSWNDKVLIKSVGQAGDNGGPLEAPQIDDLTSGNQGSVLNGAGGKDQIQAKAGWDIIDGGADYDFIRAGNGRDIITGGFGADELWGDFGWNTYKSEKDGSRDLIAIKSDQNLVNWLYGKAGNNPNGEKADIIEGLDSNDVIKIVGASTESLSFANASAHGLSGIGIYAGGALEALYTGEDLNRDQIRGMTSGDASAAAMNNSLSGYGVW